MRDASSPAGPSINDSCCPRWRAWRRPTLEIAWQGGSRSIERACSATPAPATTIFSDLPQLAAELAARGTVLDADSLRLGALPPERSPELDTAVLAAFFGEWLQGRHTDLFMDPPFTELRVQSRH